MYKDFGRDGERSMGSSLAASQGKGEMPRGAEAVKAEFGTTLAEFGALPPEIQKIIQDEVRETALAYGPKSPEATRCMVELVRMTRDAISGRGEIGGHAPDALIGLVEQARKLKGVKSKNQ